jgi:hypothetical protein
VGLAHRAEARRRSRLLRRVAALREVLDDLEGEGPAGQAPAEAGVVRAGGLAIDARQRSATLDGRRLALNTTEFDLLVALVRWRPKTLSAHPGAQALGWITELEARTGQVTFQFAREAGARSAPPALCADRALPRVFVGGGREVKRKKAKGKKRRRLDACASAGAAGAAAGTTKL